MRITLLLGLPFLILFFSLITLTIRALLKYTKSKDVRKEKAALRITLGERLKKERIDHKMTQEFVAETLGVSRQAVSKWENGASDPSTANLIAIANLYKIDVEDLLKDIQTN
ncbi:MAG: helix-turn-helix domain-containing protein, partial [Tetragenococcus koreensis]|nr:helix-turn-helix domain-containing protein [Tetragenococcus koreensis]MDN6146822.1 helix-turn-helix domain-containing protein [Tetragenococcus koreensis]MDN6167244.1 helix-turn-helix domain-containing protein [Tetragenococcus koreensis]MDN6640961.1 helix-turn-helix domain-containing protein [Tetragenococcus sp.]